MSRHDEVIQQFCDKWKAGENPFEGLYYKSVDSTKWIEKREFPAWLKNYDYAYHPPREITAYGHTFREPLREAPEDGVTVYKPDTSFKDGYVQFVFDGEWENLLILLKRGQLFLHKEDAIACAKAQIAMTGGEVNGE